MRILTIFAAGSAAYVATSSRAVKTKRIAANAINDPPPPAPPDSSTETTYGGGGEDVRILSPEQVDGLLQEWTADPRWNHDDIATMGTKVRSAGRDDIFFAYCPEYRDRRAVRYIFHTQVVMRGSAAVLQVNHAAKCPFDPSPISSVGFKSSLKKALPILPIDFTPLLECPRFRLSWNLQTAKGAPDQS